MLWRRQDGRFPNWGNIADDANLCTATVSNFAHGVTRRPHAHTVVSIAIALGWVPMWQFGNEPPAPLGSLAMKTLPNKGKRKPAKSKNN
jgi:hypothetical protein